MLDFLFGWRKASKCKKLMRQVQCRLVLLKNKRCSIARQLRLDVAQLIKLGHAQIAFTRAEQVYKDERIIEVYDLLDHFCEFILINLAYIRRHKDCPNDINEAMSSLIFASARCGDIPELRKVRKLFGERYGQRFVMSALELLPGNLVNSQIRNNLSIKTVAEDAKNKVVNEIFRDCHIFQGSSESPLAIGYNSEWHQKQTKEDVADNKILCITLPVSSPADHHSSRSKALVPVTQGPEKQEKSAHIGISDETNIIVPEISHSSELVQCLEENVVYLDDIQEFRSPNSKDIHLFDRRVFIFESLVLPKKQKLEDDLPGVKSFKQTSKLCNRKSKKRSTSREYWSFKDLSYENYYGNNQRKQLRGHTDYSCSNASSTYCPKQGTDEVSRSRRLSSHEVINESGMEETKESEFYSCSDCSSRRSVLMPNEHQDTEHQSHFTRHSSLQVHELKHGNHIHPKLPDYKELESKFLALKNEFLLNKNL